MKTNLSNEPKFIDKLHPDVLLFAYVAMLGFMHLVRILGVAKWVFPNRAMSYPHLFNLIRDLEKEFGERKMLVRFHEAEFEDYFYKLYFALYFEKSDRRIKHGIVELKKLGILPDNTYLAKDKGSMYCLKVEREWVDNLFL